jgi:hypothetical protein
VLEVARQHAARARNPKLLRPNLHLDPLGDVHGLRGQDGLHGCCLALGRAGEAIRQCSAAAAGAASNASELGSERELPPAAATPLQPQSLSSLRQRGPGGWSPPPPNHGPRCPLPCNCSCTALWGFAVFYYIQKAFVFFAWTLRRFRAELSSFLWSLAGSNGTVLHFVGDFAPRERRARRGGAIGDLLQASMEHNEEFAAEAWFGDS